MHFALITLILGSLLANILFKYIILFIYTFYAITESIITLFNISTNLYAIDIDKASIILLTIKSIKSKVESALCCVTRKDHARKIILFLLIDALASALLRQRESFTFISTVPEKLRKIRCIRRNVYSHHGDQPEESQEPVL